MMRTLLLLAAVAALSLGAASSVLAQREARIDNWAGYLEPNILEDFEAEAGIKPIEDYFDSNEMLETKMLTGASGYEAHGFVNFMLRPDIIARASNFVWYANGNLPSREFLDSAVVDNPSIYPDGETLANLFTVQAYPPKMSGGSRGPGRV